MHTWVSFETGTMGTIMVPAGRKHPLTRANPQTSSRAVDARPRLNEDERLSIRPLGQKILVVKINRNRVTVGVQAKGELSSRAVSVTVIC